MKIARRIHLLLGVFFAPAIVFFAATGAMQVLGLQQRREGRPPASWISHVVEVHKHQRWEPRKRAPAATASAPASSASPSSGAAQVAPSPEPKTTIGATLLEGFVILMSAGLVTTTALGLYMAWLVPRDRKLALALFAAGCLVPAAFLFF